MKKIIGIFVSVFMLVCFLTTGFAAQEGNTTVLDSTAKPAATSKVAAKHKKASKKHKEAKKPKHLNKDVAGQTQGTKAEVTK
ncbi:MAG: hypothetical protein NTU54_03130 [Candidatus Omnitrophica bacterium]|nr:hypothetical protein [Candidatus Omnitrophota bacterium]